MVEATKYIGCLLGGAVGDALGYPVKSMTYAKIASTYGLRGITELSVGDSGKALITDGTQMTLFTTEGLMWAKRVEKKHGYCNIAARCFYSYQRWLHTQGIALPDPSYQWVLEDKRLDLHSFLLQRDELYATRISSSTCTEALSNAKEQNYGTIEEPINNSKDNGGVMRTAPVGLCFFYNPKKAYEVGSQIAAITHGHPTGFISAGTYAAIIAHILNGATIENAVLSTISLLAQVPGGQETMDMLRKVMALYESGEPNYAKLVTLGKGNVADEALGIGVYAALSYSGNLKRAVILAVNHDGDSSVTGAICGSIVGAYIGKSAIPKEWMNALELEDVIEEMGLTLFETYSLERYK